MIPLTAVSDEYIDWPILTEQKTIQHIVPPALNWVGRISYDKHGVKKIEVLCIMQYGLQNMGYCEATLTLTSCFEYYL